MKIIKMILMAAWAFALTTFVQAKSSYYYYHGNRIPITLSDDSVTVYTIVNNSDNTADLAYQFTTMSISGLDYIERNTITSIEPVVSGFDGPAIKIANRFYVQLYNPTTDLPILQEVATKTNTILLGQVPYVTDWYVLEVHHSIIDNSLEMSNYFYETGLFKSVDPGFIFNYKPSSACVTDSNFSDQWGPQAINACSAWNISKGFQNIKIAIIDKEIYQNHTEFYTTQFANSYNCMINPCPAINAPEHGTMICGIIAADHNHANIAGIAPNCKIIPITHWLGANEFTSEELASGLSWATSHGADVINCSWGAPIGGQAYAYLHSDLLETQILNALTTGRNGKGCIVVFAAGNEGVSQLNYPAYVYPDIVTVGAISSTYTHAGFSSYGNNIDVVAPGVDIFSTTETGGYMSGSGTSYAAPYVSGLAGLILSVNPYLTQKEVADIIESTAQKVGNYMYTSQQNRPNGDWNLRMGYGLVDAYEAVKKAKDLVIGGPGSMCDTAKYYLLHPLPTGESVTWSLDNGSVFNPHYTIVGPTDQDTVLVVCTDYYVLSSMRDGNEDLRDPILPHWDTLPAPLSNNKAVIATIVSDSTRTYTKALRHAYSKKPVISGSSSAFWPANSQRTFTVTNCPLLPDSAFYWTIMISTATNSQHAYGRTLSIFSPNIPAGTIRGISICVENLYDKCGNGLSDTLNYIVIKTIPLGVTCSNDHLLIEVPDENGESQYVTSRLSEGNEFTLELWHSIYGCVRILPVYSGSERIDIAGLPKGTYVLLLKENGDVISDAKILI